MTTYATTNAHFTAAPQWRIVYTYPNTEKKIYTELNKRSIDAFLPLNTVVRQWSDRKKKLEVPLFPNYLFVKITPKQMYSVLNVTGVVRFISFGGQVAVVRNEEIETIQRLLEASEEVNNESNCEIGDWVHVIDGPFKGMEGIVADKKGATRLFIELKTMNQFVSVEVPSYNLSKRKPLEAAYQ